MQDRKYFTKRLAQLDSAYQEYAGMWRDLADYYLPRTCKFLVTDTNKKPRFSSKIVDSSTGIAVRNFASGMMSGATNPAQKWFKVAIRNYQNKDDYETKQWCSDVSELFRNIFNASNFYNCLPNCYLQLGVFGISAMSIEKDFDNVIFCKVLPIGSYKMAKDHRGVVDTLYRCYMDTVGNIVDKFGIDNVTDSTKLAYEKENYEQLLEITHAIEPNQDWDKNSKFADKKQFISVYFEKSGDKFLSKSGFNHFPYIVFEASVNGEDVYPSDCPGIIAFPDIKQLMAQIRDYNKAIKKIITPIFKGPSSLKNKKLSDAPGAFIPTEGTGNDGLTPVYQVDPRVLTLENEIEKLKQTIGKIFYNDLFAMLTNSDFTQPRTATELNMRKEESLVLLSPLLQQIHSGLKQIMNVVFEICVDVDIVPQPPQQIQGKEINIEFVSTLAQAMKAAIIGAMERFTTFIGNISSSVEPNAKLKVNWFETIDDYADYTNIDPDNIVPTDQVMAQIQAQQQAQQQQQQMENMKQGSEMIKNMGGADSSGGNLMERIGLQ